jgi:hypothetical protein
MLLADHYCFGVIAHRIHQNIGMGGDDQLGSVRSFHEVIGQLRGECGARQVAGAELGLVHSLGAGFATNATTILGTEATL